MSLDPTDETVKRVRAHLRSRRGVVEKSMMGSLAFMVDGAMCCAIGPQGLLVRVVPEDRPTLLAMPHVTPMQLGARVMRGFVRVAPAGYRSDAALATWIDGGIAAGRVAKPASGKTVRVAKVSAAPKRVQRAATRARKPAAKK